MGKEFLNPDKIKIEARDAFAVNFLLRNLLPKIKDGKVTSCEDSRNTYNSYLERNEDILGSECSIFRILLKSFELFSEYTRSTSWNDKKSKKPTENLQKNKRGLESVSEKIFNFTPQNWQDAIIFLNEAVEMEFVLLKNDLSELNNDTQDIPETLF